MKKYLVRVWVFKQLNRMGTKEKDVGKIKCNISTIPVDITGEPPNIICKSQVSPEEIELKTFGTNCFKRSGEIEYRLIVEIDGDLLQAEKQGLEHIERHFGKHKCFRKKYYEKFIEKKELYGT